MVCNFNELKISQSFPEEVKNHCILKEALWGADNIKGKEIILLMYGSRLIIIVKGDVDSQVCHSTVLLVSYPIQLTFAWRSHLSGETDSGAPISTIK